MPHPIYQARLVNAIEHALSEARVASLESHPGLVGRYRELLAESLLKPLLPAGYAVGTGKIVDSFGASSDEVDLIIYHKGGIPPVLWSDRDGVFPIESCVYAIEVKSVATKAALLDGLTKAKRIAELRERRYSDIAHTLSARLPFVFFAFDSAARSFDTDLLNYLNLDSHALHRPEVNVLCICGRGYASFDAGQTCWTAERATPKHDEIVSFLIGVANSLLRDVPPTADMALGPYLRADHLGEAMSFAYDDNSRTG